MKVGYVRVSTAQQNEMRQLEQLKGQVERIFCDKASGKNKERPELEKMLDFVREGDEIIVCSMDRLSRNLRDLLQMVESLQARGISIVFLKEGFSFKHNENSPVAKLTLQIMGSVAEFERQIILERQREGIALAKERGVYKGRKPLSEDMVNKIIERSKMGVPATKIAKDLGIGVASCYRYLKNVQRMNSTQGCSIKTRLIEHNL